MGREGSLLRLSRPSEPSFAGTFPSWLTEADRRLTVEKALATAGLWNIDGMWDLATSCLDTRAPGKMELSATSILTVASLTVRKRILEVADRGFSVVPPHSGEA